jgi:KUP system potassium uptake protein
LIASIEGAFLVANLFKIPHGGWFTIAVAAIVFTLMTTWKTGRKLLKIRSGVGRLTVRQLAHQIDEDAEKIHRIPGNAVYLFSQPGVVSPGLLTQLRASNTLHEHVYIVTVVTEDRPHVLPVQRIESVSHPQGIHEVVLHYGFMEEASVATDLDQRLSIHPEATYYFVGRETVKAEGRLDMARWRERLFAIMNRNAADVSEFFDLPADRVIELGQRVRM